MGAEADGRDGDLTPIRENRLACGHLCRWWHLEMGHGGTFHPSLCANPSHGTYPNPKPKAHRAPLELRTRNSGRAVLGGGLGIRTKTQCRKACASHPSRCQEQSWGVGSRPDPVPD